MPRFAHSTGREVPSALASYFSLACTNAAKCMASLGSDLTTSQIAMRTRKLTIY